MASSRAVHGSDPSLPVHHAASAHHPTATGGAIPKLALLSLVCCVVSVAQATADTIQGFVYTAGIFTDIPMPGLPQGINDAGQIVGWSDSQGRGFLYSAGTFSPIMVPGSVSTGASDINDSGQIVGNFVEGPYSQKGFLYDAGTYITLDVPGGGWPFGINDAGQAVGVSGVGGRQNGFLYDSGTYTIIDVPGQPHTYATDINDAGQIIGSYHDGTRWHNFLYDAGSFTTIDVPGSLWGFTSGINDAGQIVGFWSDGSRYHGFLYDAGSFTSFGVFGRHIIPEGINDAGQIVGWSEEIPVPEPGLMLMLGSGVAGIWAFASQKRRSG